MASAHGLLKDEAHEWRGQGGSASLTFLCPDFDFFDRTVNIR